jgi:hypothetical protein
MNNKTNSQISNLTNMNKNNKNDNNIKNSNTKNNSLFETCKNFFMKNPMMPMLSFKDIVAGSLYTFPMWAILLIIIGIIIII